MIKAKISHILLLFIASFIVYTVSWVVVDTLKINNLKIQSEDTVPTMFIPLAILQKGTLYLDDYYALMISKYPQPDDKDQKLGLTPFYLKKIQGENLTTHYVSAFPIISGLLALPVYLLPVLMKMPITFDNLAILGRITSSIILSMSAVFLYKLLYKYLVKDNKKSFILTCIYLFGTVNFALLSQALWQHGTLELFIILGIYLLFEFKDKSSQKFNKSLITLFFASLSLGIAVITRPTAALSWVLIAVWFFYISRKDFSNKTLLTLLSVYILGLLLVLAFFVWYNGTFYLSLQNQGYYDQLATSWKSRFPEGFLGVWLSPSKGILVYSPVFIFSLVGLWQAVKKYKNKSYYIYIVSGLIVLIHTLVIGWWKHWYGGWSFGYRMSSDVIPFLVLCLVPYVQSNLYEKTKKIFYALLIFSVGVQIYGMIFFDGIWHAAYDKGYENTSWLWSIKDSEIAFNIRRLLVKLNLLDRACPQCLQ